MKYTLLILFALVLCGCGLTKAEREQQRRVDELYRVEVARIRAEQAEAKLSASEDTTGIEEKEPVVDTLTRDKPLNEIRFGDWTDEDWYDNEYFRFLRKCFDDYYKKGIVHRGVNLQDYKSLLPNRFFIYNAEPFISGGMFITLGFVSAPQILYETVVYSEVDRGTETVGDFSLRGFRKSEMTTTYTSDEILGIIEENPDLTKLW